MFFASEPTSRSGRGATTVQVWVAGAPVFPAVSAACTAKECEPTASEVYDAGLPQGANAPPSSEQAKDEPGSFDENVKLAPVSVVGDAGPEPIVTTGGVVSGGVYVQATDAGAPTFPALSSPFTANWCWPAASAVSTAGLAQAVYAAPSNEQENETAASFALKPISAASVEVAAAGPLVIVTMGAFVSAAGGFDVTAGSGSGWGAGFGFAFGCFGVVVTAGAVVGGGVTAVVGGIAGSEVSVTAGATTFGFCFCFGFCFGGGCAAGSVVTASVRAAAVVVARSVDTGVVVATASVVSSRVSPTPRAAPPPPSTSTAAASAPALLKRLARRLAAVDDQ